MNSEKVFFLLSLRPFGAPPSQREALRLAETSRGFPLGGKLSAELTDEGDIRPLPFKASNTVGRGLAAAEKSIITNGLCPLIRHGLGRDTFPPWGKASGWQKPKEAPLCKGGCHRR